MKLNRQVNRVFIHCSASSNTHVTAKDVDSWHRQRGWSGIGYHYFIRSDGQLETGRSLEVMPAAQSGHNTGTIAICLNGLHVNDFTEAQFTTLRDLCSQINTAIPGVTFHGHKEVSAKTCPVFDYRAVLGLDNNGRMVGKQVLKTQAELSITDGEPARCLISKTAVQEWQRRNALTTDGIIGPASWRVITGGRS
jgi:hypothetical protein